MDLEYILNNLITSGLDVADPDVIRKHKVLNFFHLTIFILAPILGGFFYFFAGSSVLLYSSIAVSILMVFGMLLLRLTKNLLLSGNVALFILWAFISIISWKTGPILYDGIINPTWILNAGLILIAIFLNGYLSGTVWAIIIFIQTGIIMLLFRKGYQFAPGVIPPDIAATYFMGIYLICLLVILLFAFLFEREKSDALMREQNKSHTIREAKKYMDSIFDRYPLPTFVIDNKHRVIQWNRACSEISGFPPEEILGKEVWKGFHMDGQGQSMADILIEGADSISELYKEEIVSSERGWYETNTILPNLSGVGRVTITVAHILDDNGIVRGAIQTIQELKQIPVEGGFQDYLAEHFPKAVFKVDANGKINFWNNACTDLLGYDSNRSIGQSPLSFVAKNYGPLFKKIFIKVIKGKSITNQELKYVTAENKPVYVMVRIFPCHNNESGLSECVFVNTDVTGLQLKLKKMKQIASENSEKYKELSEEYNLLKKNIANFVRKKENPQSDQ